MKTIIIEEMTKEEMIEVDGGGIGKILKDFWQGVCDGVRELFEDCWPI